MVLQAGTFVSCKGWGTWQNYETILDPSSDALCFHTTSAARHSAVNRLVELRYDFQKTNEGQDVVKDNRRITSLIIIKFA